MSPTIRHKYKYFHSTVQRAKDRRQKFHYCRLPFDVRPRNVKLNFSISCGGGGGGGSCVTHKNLVYDLARLEFSIAQWVERSTGILEGHRIDSHWGTQKMYFLSKST